MRTIPLAAACCAAALLLTGCSEDGSDPETSPTPSASGSASGSSSPSPSETTPTEPSQPPAPAATGVVHETSLFTVQAPTKDYVSRRVSGDKITALSDLAAGDNVYLSIRPGYGGYTLDQVAEQLGRSLTYVGKLEAQDDVEIDGEPALHLSGRMSGTRHADVFAVLHDEKLVEISFETLTDPQERQRVIDTTLATFAWR